MTKITKSLSRGLSVMMAAPSDEAGVSVIGIDWGVMVAVCVAVRTGKINVIAGNGKSVVVAVGGGVSEGVVVNEGVPCVPVGVEVLFN